MKNIVRTVIFFSLNMASDEWCPYCDHLLFESGDLFDVATRISYYQSKTKLQSAIQSKTREEIEEDIDFNRITQKFLKSTDVSFDTSEDSLVCDNCGSELKVRHDEKLLTDSVFEKPNK